MGITFKIDSEAGVIFSVAEGKIGEADIRDLGKRFTEDPLFHSEFAHLFDGLSATLSFSSEEARTMAASSKKNRPGARTAIVINKEAQGWARMYQAWRGNTHHIFHNMASAREWLGLPPEV